MVVVERARVRASEAAAAGATASSSWVPVSRQMGPHNPGAICRQKGTYEDGVVALDALDSDARTRACSTNTIEYLFGSKAHG